MARDIEGEIVIYLLTYDHPHRKTQDLVFRLRGIDDLVLVLLPWEDRRNHRPLFETKLPPSRVVPRNYGLPICAIDAIPDGSVVIIGGAGILPNEFVTKHIVVNSHCGWLPFVRGLDALKWAIYDGEKIGCTTHLINSECDAGLLIDRNEVELDVTDSLFSIAMRQYELELDMMVDCVCTKGWEQARPFTEPKNDPRRRMDHRHELKMMHRLESRCDYD